VPVPTVIKALPVPTDAQAVWLALFNALTPADTFIRSSLNHCQPVGLHRGTLTIRHPENDLIETPRNIATLKARLLAATGHALEVAFEVGNAIAPPAPVAPPTPRAPVPSPESRPNPTDAPVESQKKTPAPAPQLLSKDEFINDPAIKAALEIFKGQIIEVRAPGSHPPDPNA
jgi:hypothetical protein